MTRQLIYSSNILEYHIDTLDGVEMISRFPLFYQVVSEELSEDRAQILAEPVKNLDHNRINWYSSLTGRAVPFEELPEEDQRFANDIIDERKAELAALAERFSKSPARNRKLAGELLSRILNQPESFRVFLVGGRPVVAGWGLSPLKTETAGAAAGDPPGLTVSGRLTEKVTAAPRKTLPPPAVYVKEDYSLLKLFLGLILGFNLLAVLFFLLFPGLKLFFEQLLNPPEIDAAAFDHNSEEEGRLRAELAELRRLYYARLSGCPVPQAEEPAEPAASLPDEGALDSPQALPDAPPPEKPGSRALEIPEGAEEKNDFSFMEGCWESSADEVRSIETKLPLVVKYCFDRNGRARVTVDEHDARGRYTQTCSTTARASFKNGSIVIAEQGPEVCPNGRRYSKTILTCSPDAGSVRGKVDCYLAQPATKHPPFKAGFERVEQ
ncbi:MAG: hypothetical protein LBP22_16550 [Deltaproteobacteria bacterium]|jgi:hypothetical protein|nr:hypothetical protein [Deltaproteobacteria bacterium]